MEWSGVFRIVTAGLASVGGAGLIIIAVANWLAKLWAKRILEHDKKWYSKQMEELLQKHRCELKELQEQLNMRCPLPKRTVYSLLRAMGIVI